MGSKRIQIEGTTRLEGCDRIIDRGLINVVVSVEKRIIGALKLDSGVS